MIAHLEIDLGAIRRNVARMRSLVSPSRFAAVVKANAYGHGVLETARAIANDVDLFCTYRFDEAATLRDGGITTPILVLGPTEPRELGAAHACGVALTLWDDGAYRRDVARIARKRRGPFPVHAKIDTGVTRLGLDVARAPAVVGSYVEDRDLDVRGVYTHLAAAEELESEYTYGQIERFTQALAPLTPTLAARRILRHSAASAAAMLYPASRFDLVRAGIAAYGIWPSPLTQTYANDAIVLEPALAWRTQIVTVRDVEAGRPVGYGCTYVTGRASRIGVLPIGYAEGVPRALSGRGHVLVEGRRVPIIGRICMNMAFIDVTDVPAARPGSAVTLVGRDGEAMRDANDLAAEAGTIGYELMARLPAGVPRHYTGSAPPGPCDQETAAIASARSSVPS